MFKSTAEEIAQRVNQACRTLAADSAKAAAEGLGIGLVLEAEVEEPAEVRAVCVVLAGELPRACVEEVRDVIARWNQDLRLGHPMI